MYIEFRAKFESYPLISLIEIQKAFPKFDRRRLVEWQKKGYIQNIKRGFYRFKEKPINEGLLYFSANKIYKPSYVSLESALSFYQIIPEAVFSITSISTLNTSQLETPIGTFTYKHVKPLLFFGYRMVEKNSLTIAFAFPEKAILDFLYLHSELESITDFEALRWNKEIVKTFDFKKISDYLILFKNNSLNKRFQLFLEFIHA